MAMTRIRLMAEPASCLLDYERIPISFQVSERIDVSHLDVGHNVSSYHTRPVPSPYLKDYDTLPGQRPGVGGEMGLEQMVVCLGVSRRATRGRRCCCSSYR